MFFLPPGGIISAVTLLCLAPRPRRACAWTLCWPSSHSGDKRSCTSRPAPPRASSWCCSRRRWGRWARSPPRGPGRWSYPLPHCEPVMAKSCKYWLLLFYWWHTEDSPRLRAPWRPTWCRCYPWRRCFLLDTQCRMQTPADGGTPVNMVIDNPGQTFMVRLLARERFLLDSESYLLGGNSVMDIFLSSYTKKLQLGHQVVLSCLKNSDPAWLPDHVHHLWHSLASPHLSTSRTQSRNPGKLVVTAPHFILESVHFDLSTCSASYLNIPQTLYSCCKIPENENKTF